MDNSDSYGNVFRLGISRCDGIGAMKRLAIGMLDIVIGLAVLANCGRMIMMIKDGVTFEDSDLQLIGIILIMVGLLALLRAIHGVLKLVECMFGLHMEEEND